jgi:hypothetical protein
MFDSYAGSKPAREATCTPRGPGGLERGWPPRRRAASDESRVRAAARAREEMNHFADKLLKLIPGEAVALYLFAHGLIGLARQTVLIVWSVFCLVIAGLVRYIGAGTQASRAGCGWRSETA